MYWNKILGMDPPPFFAESYSKPSCNQKQSEIKNHRQFFFVNRPRMAKNGVFVIFIAKLKMKFYNSYARVCAHIIYNGYRQNSSISELQRPKNSQKLVKIDKKGQFSIVSHGLEIGGSVYQARPLSENFQYNLKM